MSVSLLLKIKGKHVNSIAKDSAVSDALAALCNHKIGALVVLDESKHLCGILSERDIIQGLHHFKHDIMTHSVADLMTAPVETWAQDGAEWMAFTMPSSYTLESLPAPVDAGVVLTECEGRDVAVLGFSGRFHQSKSEKLGERLKSMVVKQGLTPTQGPILAVYDGPMTLPFKRRNEILLPVERVSLKK